MMFDGEFPHLVEAEAREAERICGDLGAVDLGAQHAEIWWDRRYVFYYPPFGCTFGEIELDRKNTVSHRAQALKALRQALADLL